MERYPHQAPKPGHYRHVPALHTPIKDCHPQGNSRNDKEDNHHYKIHSTDQQKLRGQKGGAPYFGAACFAAQTQVYSDGRNQAKSAPCHAGNQSCSGIHPVAPQLVYDACQDIPKKIKVGEFLRLAWIIAWVYWRYPCTRDGVNHGRACGVVIRYHIEIQSVFQLDIDQPQNSKSYPDCTGKNGDYLKSLHLALFNQGTAVFFSWSVIKQNNNPGKPNEK